MWIFKQLLRQWRTLGIRVWRRLLRSERRQWSVRRQRSVEEAALGSPSPGSRSSSALDCPMLGR